MTAPGAPDDPLPPDDATVQVPPPAQPDPADADQADDWRLAALPTMHVSTGRMAESDDRPASSAESAVRALREAASSRPRIDGDAGDSPHLSGLEVTGTLGEGGMGIVFQVRDPILEREVAAKVLRPGAHAHLERKFVQEARIAGALDHPGIVPIHELRASQDGRLFFTMPRVEGVDLQQRLDLIRHDIATGQADPQRKLVELLHAFVKICDAIGFAHSRGVIHRDLKPANVMLGEFGEVLVMDWGLARRLGETQPPPDVDAPPAAAPAGADDATLAGDPLRTRPGTILGTPAYMAPEQARGEVDAVDERSDVYGLGAILYQLLCYAPPVDGDAVLDRVRRGDFPSPRERRPDLPIPWELETVALRAMALDPARRYPSAAALRDDVLRWFEGRALSAVEYSGWQRTAKWIARNRRRLAVAALVVLAAAGTGLAARWSAEARSRAALAGLVSAARDAAGKAARPDADLELAMRATTALDRALEALPDDDERRPTLRATRRATGHTLARIATDSGDYTLAFHALADLRRHGEAETALEAGRKTIAAHRDRALRQRAARLRAILADLGDEMTGEGRTEKATSLDDHLFEAIRYREPQTVAILGEALDDLIARDPRLDRGQRLQATFALQVLGRLDLPARATPVLARALRRLRSDTLRLEAAIALARQGTPDARRILDETVSQEAHDSRLWVRLKPLYKKLPPPPDVDGDDPAAHFARSLLCIIRDDFPGARRHLDTVLRVDPEHVPARVNRGMVLSHLGDLDAARADLEGALRREPKSARALAQLATVEIRAGRHEQAAAHFRASLALDDQRAWTHHDLGVALVRLGRLPEARKSLDRAVGLRPDQATIRLSRSRLALRMGDIGGALDDLDIAVRLAPERIELQISLGWTRLRNNDVAGAREAANAALAIDPRNPSALTLLAQVHVALRDRASAHRYLEKARRLGPKCAPAWHYSGRLAIDEGRLEDSLDLFGRAVEADPGYWQSSRRKAEVLTELDRDAEARDVLEAALALTPNEPDLLFVLATVQVRRRDIDGALATIRRILALAPRHARAHRMHGRIHLARGDYDQAAEALAQALRIDPADAAALALRAECRYHQGQHEAGLADINRAIVLERSVLPRSAYVVRAEILLALGRPRGALVDLDTALSPETAGRPLGAEGVAYVQLHRGTALARLGDKPAALRALTLAITGNPDLALGYEARGRLLVSMDQRAKARADLDRALELEPALVDARLDRALLRIDEEDRKGAFEDVAYVLERAPKLGIAYAIRARLHEAEEDFESALPDYRKAVEYGGIDVETFYRCALLELHIGKNREKALATMLGAKQHIPTPLRDQYTSYLARLYGVMGDLRRKAKDIDGAIADYRKCTALAPKNWQAWSNLAALHSYRNDHANTVAALERALPLAPVMRRERLAQLLAHFRKKLADSTKEK